MSEALVIAELKSKALSQVTQFAQRLEVSRKFASTEGAQV
jgi:hypothetical protein